MILTGVGVWLLQTTFGETVKEAWKRTPFHRRLANFLANSTPADENQTPAQPASKVDNLGEDGERWQLLRREFAQTFAVHEEFGRFQVTHLTISSEPNGDMRVRVQLGLADEYSELDGTFKQVLYGDVISKLAPKAQTSRPRKRTRK